MLDSEKKTWPVVVENVHHSGPWRRLKWSFIIHERTHSKPKRCKVAQKGYRELDILWGGRLIVYFYCYSLCSLLASQAPLADLWPCDPKWFGWVTSDGLCPSKHGPSECVSSAGSLRHSHVHAGHILAFFKKLTCTYVVSRRTLISGSVTRNCRFMNSTCVVNFFTARRRLTLVLHHWGELSTRTHGGSGEEI